MKTGRIILTVAGIGVVLLLSLGLLEAQASQNNATPTSESDSATATPTAQSSLVIQPKAIVIPGHHEGGFREGGLWHLWSERVTYNPVPLTVFLSEAQAGDGAERNQGDAIQILHPPVYANGNSADLNLTKEEACATRVLTPAGAQVTCYTITVAGTPLPPGEYSSSLSVRAGDAAAQTVDVTVKVRRNFWFLFFVVAAGVLVTEFITRWRTQWQYGSRWQVRRQAWLDLLTEKARWVDDPNPLASNPDVIYAVVHKIKAELRQHVNTHREWLGQGRQGEITIGQLPGSADDAGEKTHSLKQAIRRYLKGSACADMISHQNDLQSHLEHLGKAAVTEAQGNLAQAKVMASALYVAGLPPVKIAYDALAALWQVATPPADKALLAVWNRIQTIWQTAQNLQNTYNTAVKNQPAPASTPASVSNAVTSLTRHLETFRQSVIEAARGQIEHVNGVNAGTPGKQETEAVLAAFAGLEARVAEALLEANGANQPLRYYAPGGAVSMELAASETSLSALDQAIGVLRPEDLGQDALRDYMLRQVQQNLATAEKAMSQPQAEMAKSWQELSLLFRKDRRLRKVGESLRKAAESPSDPGNITRNARLQRAYQHLLDGDVLAAEIQLERWEERYVNRIWIGLKQWGEAAVKMVEAAVLRPVLRIIGGIGQVLSSLKDLPSYRTPLSPDIGMLLNLNLRKSVPVYTVPTGIILLIVAGVVVVAVVAGIVWSFRTPAVRHISLFVVPAVVFLLLLPWLWNTRLVKDARRLIGELVEGVVPTVKLFFLALLSNLLTIVVATTVVIVANNLADSADTWGATFDIIAAFTFGVVANRVAEPIQSGWEALVTNLKPAPAAKE